jgi:Flp pilus assembly protein TadG
MRGACRASDDTGAVAVIVALVMTVSLILAAFAVDIGNAYAQGRQLAVSADAAALAAARTVGEAYAQPTCTQGGLTAIGADALALTKAQAVEASNTRSGSSSDTVTAHAYCSTDGTAILVDVTTARDLATGLAGVTGIAQTHPNAKATGRWQRSLVGTIRPWAVCQSTISSVQAQAGTTLAAPLDNKWGICGTSSSGNWGSVDFDALGNSAVDLVNWTRYGYPYMPQIPGTLPADPGISRSQLPTAFRALVNTPILIPVAANYVDGTNGNNGTFQTTKLALVTVCGAFYQNQTYNTTLAGAPSTCWVNPYPATPTYTYTTYPATGTATGTIAKGSNILTVSAPVPFFTDPTWANSPDVTITVVGADAGNKDLTTSITTVTNAQTVVLGAAAKTDVTNAAVTVTVRTLVPPTYVPPAPLENNGTPFNQIQFRLERVYANSADASVPCSLADTLCRGNTDLFK